MLKDYGLERVFGVSQCLVKRDDESMTLPDDKVTDDVLVAGRMEYIKIFMTKISAALDIGKVAVGGSLKFN